MIKESMCNVKHLEQEKNGCDASWYAINTNSRCEDMVFHILSNQSFEVFFPKVPKKSNNKITEPLFPGYLFARLNLKSNDWLKIKYMQGVRNILTLGNRPVPLSDRIITSIMRKVKNDDFKKYSLAFNEGDKVKFVKGPFEGLEAVFTGEVAGRERVKVLLKAIFSWSSTVEVNMAELGKVN